MAEKELKIGLLIVATGDYIKFARELIKSAQLHFFNRDKMRVYLFTDSQKNFAFAEKIYIPHLPWPLPTLLRYHFFDLHRPHYEDRDYLFYVDVDAKFVADVGREILWRLVGVLHPGFVGKSPPYEKDKESIAYISDDEGKYYAGGFLGGKKDDFLSLCGSIRSMVELDLRNHKIAAWHDESHLNKYFRDNPPKALTPEYCYPEDDERYKREIWQENYTPKIIVLDKKRYG